MLLNNKRKFIVGGVVALTSVALITTGFATWAIAANTSVESAATPGVVAVDGSTSLTILFSVGDASYDNNLKFGPKDDGGSVASTVSGGEEDLSITLVGTVEDYHVCDSLEFAVEAYDRGTSTDTKTKINVPAAETYYTLPAGSSIIDVSSATDVVTEGDGVYNITDNVATWHKTFTFGWGSAFGNENPSEFYEGDGFIGSTAVSNALNAMNDALNNIEFLVTVTAKVVTGAV